jgi:hypothetical protein
VTRRELLIGLPLSIARADDWQVLFNGHDLAGWDGDPRLWKVEDGAIVGSTAGNAIEQNTFLIYNRPFGNFHLKAAVKLRNGNSGIQFRSTRQDGSGWVVTGYQADFSDDDERSAWGNFYEERGRGRGLMATPGEGWEKGKSLVRRGDWNDIEVLACGARMVLKLNSATTVAVRDAKSSSGVIAIQLHRGAPMRVEVRDIKIRELGDSC